MVISKLASEYIKSPHQYSRQTKENPSGIIDRLTIHHVAGRGTAAVVASNFLSKAVKSANYCIGTDGSCCCCVPEDYRAATSSSRANDSRAITIEVANSTGDPTWEVSEASYNMLIKLVYDICSRYAALRPLRWTGDPAHMGNMTVHRWFAHTNCPGPYLLLRMGDIAKEVNAMFEKKNEFTGEEMFSRMEEAADNRKWDVSPYVDKAVLYGISDGTHPGRPATRGEVMAMLVRLYESLSSSAKVTLSSLYGEYGDTDSVKTAEKS